jgi:hypothetical protein
MRACLRRRSRVRRAVEPPRSSWTWAPSGSRQLWAMLLTKLQGEGISNRVSSEPFADALGTEISWVSLRKRISYCP